MKIFLLIILALSCYGGKKNLKSEWYKPDVNSTWHWQLKGDIDLDKNVDIYIIDLFDTKVSDIKYLQKRGKKVIAYFSAGSFENWRVDTTLFKKSTIGKKMFGWDERWLDIRSKNIRNIMAKRIKLAKRKGFDGVEVDNIDGYINETGFALTYKDQLKYNIFLSQQAHKSSLAIALKNDVDQIVELEPYFDFHINEECYQYKECGKLTPFIKAGKPVFHAEYNKKNVDKICKEGKKLGFQTLILPLDLDNSFRITCK